MKKPFPYQATAIDEMVVHYEQEDRGQMVFACGTGKTLTSLWFAQKMGVKNIIVALPSLQLQGQSLMAWLNDVGDFGFDLLVVGSDKSIERQTGIKTTTDREEITNFLNSIRPKIVFQTYQSVEVLAEACQATRVVFDLGIMDEAHVTAGKEGKFFGKLLNDDCGVPIQKRLFMTATPRFFMSNDAVASMDDKEIYGKVVVRFPIEEAIRQGYLSDYKLLILWCEDKQIAKQLTEKKKYSFKESVAESREWGIVTALRKVIHKYKIKRVLSFHKSVQRAKNFGKAYNDYDEFVEVFHINHTHKIKERWIMIQQMKAAAISLMTNAKALAQGFDMPELDAVLLVDLRNSATELIQIIGRALRRHHSKKMGYVILPIVVGKDGIVNEEAYLSIQKALSAMGSHDQRILELFKTSGEPTSEPNPIGKMIEHTGDPKFLKKIDLQSFNEKLSIRVWNRLKVLNWMSWEEAKEYAAKVHKEHEMTAIKWGDWSAGRLSEMPTYPKEMPGDPSSTYAQYWDGWEDFLGKRERDVTIGFEETRIFAHQLAAEYGIDTPDKWIKWANGELEGDYPELPEGMTTSVGTYFRNHEKWKGTGDFFGKRDFHGERRSYKKAQVFAQKLVADFGIDTPKKWFEWVRGRLKGSYPELPNDIPKDPSTTYSEWTTWNNFFDTKPRQTEFRSLEECQKHFQEVKLKYGIKTSDKWRKYAKGELENIPPKPDDIPAYPPGYFNIKWSEFSKK